MKLVYSYDDYRDFLREEVQRKRKGGATISFSVLAQKTSIQSSYLSKVIAKDGHLAPDQLYLTALALDLNEAETEFLLLLLERGRTQLDVRRNQIAHKVALAREQALRTEAHIHTPAPELSERDQELYFLDPLKQIIHVCLTLEAFRRDPSSLATALGLEPARVWKCLQDLADIKIITLDHDQITYVAYPNMHLPKDSPLCALYSALQRTASLAQMQRLPSGDVYGFSATFSAGAEAQKQIQEEFLRFLAKVRELVRDADSECVFQMNFDLFPWLSRGREK